MGETDSTRMTLGSLGSDVVCPPWCLGCGPNDPMHRSEPTTIGREQTGWMSVYLLLDRFARRELMLRVDCTRYGATQTVLLSGRQADRLVRELIVARRMMRASNHASREGARR